MPDCVEDEVKIFLFVTFCTFAVFCSWSVVFVRGVHERANKLVLESLGKVMISLSSNRKTSPFCRVTSDDDPEAQSVFVSSRVNLVGFLQFVKRWPCFVMFSS